LCMQAYERMLENETHAKAHRRRENHNYHYIAGGTFCGGSFTMYV
jgi:hypothetical protein